MERRSTRRTGRIRGSLRLCRSFVCRGGLGFCSLALSQLLAVEVTDNAGYIGLRFVVWRYAMILFDPLRACVVGCESFNEIKVVALQQFAEIFGAALDVGGRIKRIRHAQLRRGLR